MPANKTKVVTDSDNVTAPVATVDTDIPAQETPADINQPTVTGFTAGDPGLTATTETDGLRKLDLDAASNLRNALSNIISYQTGAAYRHDFESALEVLRTFGFSYDVARADADATRVTEAMMANEAN